MVQPLSESEDGPVRKFGTQKLSTHARCCDKHLHVHSIHPTHRLRRVGSDGCKIKLAYGVSRIDVVPLIRGLSRKWAREAAGHDCCSYFQCATLMR